MKYNDWKEVTLKEVIQFNPTESIKKGTICKKIGMDKLSPFQRKIEGYELTEFKGGSKFRNGDTLLARITPCLENGKTAQVSNLDENEIGFGSTEFIVLREKKGLTDNNFIYYLSISPEIRNISIKSMTGTSGRQRAQTSVIENTSILLPPLEEQITIASILSSLDEKIETNNLINKKLEEMAQAMFKQWFVDFEFPTDDGEPYKTSGGNFAESELGKIPTNWSVGGIGEYVKVKSGYAFKSEWWKSEGTPVIKIKDINNNTINLNEISYVSPEKEKAAKDFFVQGGDVVIAMTGATIGKFATVPKLEGTMLVNQRVGKFFLGENPFDKLGFLYCLLKQQRIYEEIVNRGGGSAQPNISPTGIETIKIVLPPTEIINKFNSLTKNLFVKKVENDYENSKLSLIRDTLLPKLMTGEVRVPIKS